MLIQVSQRSDVKDELTLVKRYKGQVEQRYFPQSMGRLLDNWQDTVDKARNFQKPKADRTILEKDIIALRKLADTI